MRLTTQDGERRRVVDVEEKEGRLRVVIDGQEIPVDVRELSSGIYSLLHGAASFEVRVREEPTGEPGVSRMVVDLYDDEYVVDLLDPRRAGSSVATGAAAKGVQKLLAPMHGKVVRVLAARGERVSRGQGILVMEAMKMENELKAAVDGVVAELKAEPGTSVNQGALLAVIEPV